MVELSSIIWGLGSGSRWVRGESKGEGERGQHARPSIGRTESALAVGLSRSPRGYFFMPNVRDNETRGQNFAKREVEVSLRGSLFLDSSGVRLFLSSYLSKSYVCVWERAGRPSEHWPHLSISVIR